jgi:hypothetical protein
MTFYDDLKALLDKEPGPEKWKRFAILGLISALMERRIYLPYGANKRTWPNLFIFIVGRAGSGKSQIISKIKELVVSYNQADPIGHKVCLASDKVNGATFLEELISSYDPVRDQSALTVIQDEMGALFQDFGAVTFTTDLLKYFDCPAMFSKRIRNKHEVANNTCVNILTGTTKNFLKRYLPSENRGDGLVSRGIFVHEPELKIEDKFRRSPLDMKAVELQQKIVYNNIPRLLMLKGQMKETEEAFNYMQELTDKFNAQQYKHPEGSVLDGYYARKSMQVIKLGMCFAASEYSMLITKEHYKQADEWLVECEPYMNEIFSTFDMKHNKSATADLLDVIPTEKIPYGVLLNRMAQADGMYPGEQGEIITRLDTLEKMGQIFLERNTEGQVLAVQKIRQTIDSME